ncbi:retrovirus-related pol polyprotein from transposon TNT 1-94 [Tanacetum coccineum]
MNARRQNRNQAFNAGNRNDESNQIVQRVPRTESNSGKANVQCYNCNEKGHYARDCLKPSVREAKYFREQILLDMKDEPGSNLDDEENDFMLHNSFGDETLEELTDAAVKEVNASYKMIPKGIHEHKNHGKCKTVINISDDDQIDYNIIFDDPFVENNGGSNKHDSNAHDQYHDLKIDSLDSEETLEDAKESRLKMRNKMVQLDYSKLNVLYETFVPQKEYSVHQTYFSIPSTSNTCSESNEVKTDSQIPKMPKESKLLKMFEKTALAINALRDRIDVTFLEDRKRRWMSDSQNSLREFYKTDVIQVSVSLSTTLKELMEEVQEMLNILELMEQKVEKKSPKEHIFQTKIDRLLEVSLTREIQDCVLISVAEQKMSC